MEWKEKSFLNKFIICLMFLLDNIMCWLLIKWCTREFQDTSHYCVRIVYVAGSQMMWYSLNALLCQNKIDQSLEWIMSDSEVSEWHFKPCLTFTSVNSANITESFLDCAKILTRYIIYINLKVYIDRGVLSIVCNAHEFSIYKQSPQTLIRFWL